MQSARGIWGMNREVNCRTVDQKSCHLSRKPIASLIPTTSTVIADVNGGKGLGDYAGGFFPAPSRILFSRTAMGPDYYSLQS